MDEDIKQSNNYIEKDDTLIKISNDNIYMNFEIGDNEYIAFTKDSNELEEIEMMYAKVFIMNGNKILRNIENKEELITVIKEFDRRIKLMVD